MRLLVSTLKNHKHVCDYLLFTWSTRINYNNNIDKIENGITLAVEALSTQTSN